MDQEREHGQEHSHPDVPASIPELTHRHLEAVLQLLKRAKAPEVTFIEQAEEQLRQIIVALTPLSPEAVKQRLQTRRLTRKHLLDQITLPALPPEFRHADIARHYQDGEFASRLDAEIEDILSGCEGAEEAREEAHMTLSSEALATLRQLHCIALIQNGQVLPLLDIEQTATPMTALQRTHLYHAAARALLEAIATLYEERAQRAKSAFDRLTPGALGWGESGELATRLPCLPASASGGPHGIPGSHPAATRQGQDATVDHMDTQRRVLPVLC